MQVCPAGTDLWHVGFARRDITLFEPGMTMMGWGMPRNRALGVAAPLFARACAITDPRTGTRVAFVVIDTMMVTQGLHLAVLETLAADGPDLGEHGLILAATHTHSGPSGFAHHFWTNLSAPGFAPRVFEGLVAGIVGAIRDAFAVQRTARLSVGRETIPLADGTAFNRSWFAYNRNPDVAPVTRARADEATDRTVTVLRCRDLDGGLVGLVQWFGLHATTVHADNTRIHPDYKGLAAMALEDAGLGVVLAQECAGDVTPNHRFDRRRGYNVGPHDDDFANAAHVADSQVRAIRALAPPTPAPDEVCLRGALTCNVRWVDFARATCDPDFSPDGRARVTSPAMLGLAMAEGTAEGPGPLRKARALNRLAAKAARLLGRDPRLPFLDLAAGRDGRLAGIVPLHRVPPVEPTLRWVRDAIRRDAIHSGPWVPDVLPLQLLRIGDFAMLAVPFETTTVAGRRLRATLCEHLPDTRLAVVATYASAYVGYLTTFEEYQVQHYEAGYTVFGPHSLGALRSEVRHLCREAVVSGRSGPEPRRVATEPLERLRFESPWRPH